MLFLEQQARFWLLVHLIVGGALVASSTHVAIWLWRRRYAGARKLALITAGLFVCSFLLGNAIYPVYKVRVKVEYLESPAASPELVTTDKIARWFDVKEHWAALGLPLALALALVLARWKPRTDGEAIRPAVLGMAVTVAVTTWVPAILGAWVTSYRAIPG